MAGTMVRILIVLGGTWVLIRLADMVLFRLVRDLKLKEKVSERQRKRLGSLGRVFTQVAAAILYTIALIVVLGQLGINIGPVLAGAGIVGISVGLGAQSLFKDIFNGVFILLENQYDVGDVIKVAGVEGLVENLTLRNTRLRDIEGNVHVIPNGEIKVVTNTTQEGARCVIDIRVAYQEDMDRILRVIGDAGAELVNDENFKSQVMGPLSILSIDGIGSSLAVIKVMFKTMPLKQWAVAAEFNRRLAGRFKQAGIEMSSPLQTSYFGYMFTSGEEQSA